MLVLVLVVVVTLTYRTEERSYRNTLAVFRVGEDCDTVSVQNGMVCDSRMCGNVHRGFGILNYEACEMIHLVCQH